MRNVILSSVASIGLLFSAPVSAQSFLSTGTTTWTSLPGSVAVQKNGGPLLGCTLSFNLVNSGSSITANSASLVGSGGFCSSVLFTGAGWPAVWNSSTQKLTVGPIFIDTTITDGDCEGYLVFEYDAGAPESLSIETGFATPSTIPQAPSGGDCKIEGVVFN